MTSTNDITGDKLITKSSTDSYRDGWDRIFGKKPSLPLYDCGECFSGCYGRCHKAIQLEKPVVK